MFIQVNDRKELIKELKKRENEKIVIHFNCEECDDEQVTYEEEVTKEMIEQFEEKDFMFVYLICTNCGNVTKFLKTYYIQGIETDF